MYVHSTQPPFSPSEHSHPTAPASNAPQIPLMLVLVLAVHSSELQISRSHARITPPPHYLILYKLVPKLLATCVSPHVTA